MERAISVRKKIWRVYRSFLSYLSNIYELSETHSRSTHRAIFSLEFIVVSGICLAVLVGLIGGAIKCLEFIIRATGSHFFGETWVKAKSISGR